jgi:hypothetical protein
MPQILHEAMRDHSIERSLDYLRNIKPLPSHNNLMHIRNEAVFAQPTEPMMMKFLMQEHRSQFTSDGWRHFALVFRSLHV